MKIVPASGGSGDGPSLDTPCYTKATLASPAPVGPVARSSQRPRAAARPRPGRGAKPEVVTRNDREVAADTAHGCRVGKGAKHDTPWIWSWASCGLPVAIRRPRGQML